MNMSDDMLEAMRDSTITIDAKANSVKIDLWTMLTECNYDRARKMETVAIIINKLTDIERNCDTIRSILPDDKESDGFGTLMEDK